MAVAIIGIIGYFIFIPTYSYWGAAYMTLLVEWLLVFFAYRVVKKNVALKINFKVLSKSILAALVSFSLLSFLTINLVIKLSALIFVYFLILYFLKTVSRNDLRQIFLAKEK